MKVIVATTCTPDDRKTLATVRALGRAGIWVALATDRKLGQAPWSRHVQRLIRLPHPAAGVSAYAGALAAATMNAGADVVLPTTDAATAACARHRERLLSVAGLCVPDYDTWNLAHDKARLAEQAEAVAIRTPQSWTPSTRDELEAIAARISYPCVLKPRRSSGAVGLFMPASPSELLAAWDALPRVSGEVFDSTRPLVQEYVPGQIHDVATLTDDGDVCFAVTSRRLVTLPARAGMGILTEATNEPELAAEAVRLLERLRWHGPALVEFVVDARDGRPTLLEVNGRLWGGLDLTVAAGVNVPLLACRLAAGLGVGREPTYQSGLRYRWPFPAGLVWAVDSGRPLDAIRRFALPDRRTASNLRLSDPLPHLAEAAWLACRAVRARFRWDPSRLGLLKR